MSDASLALEVKLDGPGPSGTASIHNGGPDRVRLWQPGTEWGDEPLSLEVCDGRMRIGTATGAGRVYTVNLPATVDLEPGAALDVHFDAGDGTWVGLSREGWNRANELTAVYRVPPSPEAQEHGVWTGALRSAPVPLGPR